MGYDFYVSVKDKNEEIKYENTLKIVQLMTKNGGVDYKKLKKKVKSVCGTSEYLDAILQKYYIVKTSHGVKYVFCSSRVGTITPMSKEKREQVERANIIIRGENRRETKSKSTHKKPKTSIKKQQYEDITKYDSPKKGQQQALDIAFKEGSKVQNQQRADMQVKQNGLYDHVCYRFLTFANEIIYVGRAENLINRMESHNRSGHLSVLCYNRVDKVEFCTFESEDDLDIAERYYISKYQPEYNDTYKDKKYFTISELDNKEWKLFAQGARILKR